MIRQRNFSRSWIAAASHQSHAGSRVMRRAKRSLSPLLYAKPPLTDGSHCRCFQCFVFIHDGQNTGQTTGEHGFAGARRAYHQQTVSSGGRHFQGTFGVVLTAHLVEVV